MSGASERRSEWPSTLRVDCRVIYTHCASHSLEKTLGISGCFRLQIKNRILSVEQQSVDQMAGIVLEREGENSDLLLKHRKTACA